MRGSQVGMTRHDDKAFKVVRILVIGVEANGGVPPVCPSVHFSLFGVKEYAV